MTHNDLLALAKRRVLVEWHPSKKVELIFKGYKGAENICARNVVTGIIHPIYPRREYRCKEIGGNQLVALGQLL